MPRMQKCRRICSFPDYYSFIPEDKESRDSETVVLSLDEFETIRLLDHEGLRQDQCAERMGVARTTVTAIYDSARKKIAEAIVEGKRLSISGGNIEMDKRFDLLREKLRTKGDREMRAAITYENGEVFGHFGKTEHFKIYDIEDGKVTGSQIVDTNGTGHGALAGFLNAADVDVLICGGIGGGARTALAEAGIKLFAGASGDVDTVIESYLAGTLEENGDATCDHHDHHHEEGHSCGDHHGEGHSCGNGGCHH